MVATAVDLVVVPFAGSVGLASFGGATGLVGSAGFVNFGGATGLVGSAGFVVFGGATGLVGSAGFVVFGGAIGLVGSAGFVVFGGATGWVSEALLETDTEKAGASSPEGVDAAGFEDFTGAGATGAAALEIASSWVDMVVGSLFKDVKTSNSKY